MWMVGGCRFESLVSTLHGRPPPVGILGARCCYLAWRCWSKGDSGQLAGGSGRPAAHPLGLFLWPRRHHPRGPTFAGCSENMPRSPKPPALPLSCTAGVMGGATAGLLERLGYRVSAWTRTPRQQPSLGVACFHGPHQLQAFASGVDVLVCLLPLTPETRGILNARLFGWLPRGATVVNAARGGHLVVPDLLAALDSGHVRGCCVLLLLSLLLPQCRRSLLSCGHHHGAAASAAAAVAAAACLRCPLPASARVLPQPWLMQHT